jgi:PAS domain S-box-containing protein
MINKIKASIEVTLLVFIMSLFIIGVGVYGILEIKKLNQNSKELYTDRLMPMGLLGEVRFHCFNIISIAHQADKNRLSYSEALKQVGQAQDSIKSNWENYSLTYLTRDEQQIAAKTAFRINKADVYIERLKQALAAKDKIALNRILINELHPALDPIISNVNKLVTLQIKIGQEINQSNTTLYNSYLHKFWWILIIVFAIAGPFLYYLIKKNESIARSINLSNVKLFLTEENYRNLIEYAGEAILILNNETEIIDLNEYAVNLLGYSRAELLEMKASDLVAPEDIKDQASDIDAIRTNKFALLYRNVRKKDGTFIETEISNRLMEGKGFFAILRDVTARRKAEKELRQSEERYHSLIEHAGDAIFVVDDNKNIIQVNKAACELLGYSRDELQSMNAIDVYPPFESSIQPVQWELLRQNRVLLNDTKLQRKDGTIVEVEVNRKLLTDNSYLAIVRDITERKKIEAELIESKEQLRLFIKHSPASLAMLDSEMRYIATSRRWVIDYNLLGHDIIGKSHYEVFPEIGNEWKEIHQRCLKGEIEKNDEDSFIRADGSIEWLKWEIRPWHKSSGEIGGIIMFTEVITERKKATERFRNQFDNSPDIILYVNKYFKIEAINRSQPGGMSKEELVGANCIEVLPEESKEIAREALTKCFAANENQEIENVIRNNRWVRSRMVPISIHGEVTHVMIIATDITDKKKFEDELVRYNEELKKTNSELDRFVYSASHDLRAPLKSILGLINITTKDISEKANENDNHKILERLGMLNTSASKLDNFIEDILNYSRNARMEPESNVIDFEELVNDVNSNFQFLEGRKVDFKIIIDCDEKFVTDQKRLTIILNNIISNAYKYSDVTKENSFINVIFTCDKIKATIIIKDNGIGIADSDREKIFDMFYRSASISTGSGLGLYIVKEAVEKLNGTFSVNSELGIGSEFCIEIPNN